MPFITFLFGLVLIVVGVLFKAITQPSSFTLLIPVIFGVAMLVCAGAAIKAKWRMHAMHAAVLLALLLMMGAFLPIKDAFSDDRSFAHVVEALLVIVTSAAYIVMCVRSFVAARRERKLEGASGGKS